MGFVPDRTSTGLRVDRCLQAGCTRPYLPHSRHHLSFICSSVIERSMSAVRALALLVVVVVLGTLHTAFAHPSLWAASSKACIAHPAAGSSNGGHGRARADTTTSIKALDSTGAVITAVCPGSSYTIKATFNGPREALVTVTAGTISSNKDCSNRWTSPEGTRAAELSLPWTVPCALPGSTSVVKVSSASGSSAALGTTQLTLPVQASCALPACAPTRKVVPTPQPVAASSPTPAATTGTNATAPATDATAAATPAAAADAALASTTRGGATPAAVQGGAGAAPSCTPSPLGYRCVTDLPGGGRVHYSKGGAVPLNLCTRNTANAMPGVEMAQMLHFAIESPLPGYVALGFTARPTKMFPSDVVIGTRDSKDVPVLQTYRLQGYTLNAAADINRGWTSNTGLVRNGANTLMCFSRPVNTVNARVTTNLDTSAVAMIWAMSPGTALVEHTQQGSLLINMDTGVSSSRADRVGGAVWDIVHGALMLAAFVALMPAAVLLARHKWLFGNPKPGWFKLHIWLQVLAVACAVASIVLIFVAKGWEPGSHRLFNAHKVLGMIVTALAVVQVGVGAARPDLKSPKRSWWRGGHYTIGYTTMLAGITNCFLGLFMVHDIRGHALMYWLVPTAVLSGVWLLLGAALEVEKIKLQVAKLYNPKTHAFHGKQGLLKTALPGDLAAAQGDNGIVLHASGSNPGTPTHRRGNAANQF